MTNIQNIRQCAVILEEIGRTNSPKEKKTILSSIKAEDKELDTTMQKIFKYAYDKAYTYKIGEKKIAGILDAPHTFVETEYEDIFALLDHLAGENGVDNSLLQDVTNFIVAEPSKEVRQLYINIILKDLRVGATGTIANKVWKGLIPEFDMQSARKYEDRADKIIGEEVAITVKEDGIRGGAIVRDGSVLLKTKHNRVIEGCLEIEKEIQDKIKNLPQGNYLVDGELVYSGSEDIDSAERYRKTVEIVNSKQDNKTNLIYIIFDIIKLEEFESKTLVKDWDYNHRRALVEDLCSESNLLKPVELLYQGVASTEVIAKFLKLAIENEQEGIMINITKAPYEYKRTNNVLKVKQVYHADLKVIEVIEGKGAFEGTLGSLVVDYKGYSVGVGGGFTKAERDTFWANKEDLIGRVVEVKYTEETQNNQDGISLRFPRFVQLRERGKEVSYD